VGLGGSGEKYMLVLTGEDPQALARKPRGGGERPAHHPRPGQRRVHRQPDAPRGGVRPDFARAADLGVTSAAIAETLRIATVGDYDVACPSSTCRQRQVPIVVKLADDARKDLDLLGAWPVPGAQAAR
jgi:multidrug efflux pump subunit AcrB